MFRVQKCVQCFSVVLDCLCHHFDHTGWLCFQSKSPLQAQTQTWISSHCTAAVRLAWSHISLCSFQLHCTPCQAEHGMTIRLFSHLVPFRQVLWTVWFFWFFLCAVWTLWASMWTELSREVVFLFAWIPQSCSLFVGQREHKAPKVRLTYTRLLDHRFPCHNQSHWCHERQKMIMCRFAEKTCYFSMLISYCRECTENPKYVSF